MFVYSSSRHIFRFIAALVLSLPALATAQEYIAPELIDINTPVYRPEPNEFEPPFGTYTYDVSWEGIPAAEVTATIEQEGLRYRITARAKTYSAIDLIYKLRYRAEGLISAVDFYPIKTTMEQKENSRHRFTEITFEPKGEVETVRVDRKKEEVKTLRFDPGNFMLDPFAAAFLARSLHWQEGESKEFDTFNGKSRYLITLTAEEKIQMDINGQMKDVWVIVPKVKNMSYPEENSKLRKAKIYLLADKSRDILKIVSSVFIGSVTTELDSFTPSSRPPSGPSLVENKSNYIK